MDGFLDLSDNPVILETTIKAQSVRDNHDLSCHCNGAYTLPGATDMLKESLFSSSNVAFQLSV